MRVKLEGGNGATPYEQIDISETAKQAIRLAFNPSGDPRVVRLKMLAAAFITECQGVQAELPEGAREAAVAITNMQTASMWAVLAATTNAPPK